MSAAASEDTGAAVDGDGINIPPGTYTLTLGSELVVVKDHTLKGAGAHVTIIQAASNLALAGFRVFSIGSGAVALSGVTIQHGNSRGDEGGASDGGGIFNRGTLTLTDTIVKANAAVSHGGGVFNQKASLTLINTIINGNKAGLGGGISSNSSTVNISDSTISDNKSSDSGGGIRHDEGVLILTNSTVSGNTMTRGLPSVRFGSALDQTRAPQRSHHSRWGIVTTVRQ